jgi:hypothetical protein
MSLRNPALQSWARYFFRLLYMLTIYCVIRLAWDWKKLAHASHPWSEVPGIVIQGLFFTLFYSLLVRDRAS